MKVLKNILSFLILSVAFVSASFGQRINFSTWSGSDDVTIRSIGASMNGLRFNEKQKVLLANSPALTIGKEDPQVAIFEIEAPSELDITVDMDYPGFLALDGNLSKGSIPFTLQMSYSNEGQPNEIAARNNSQDVPIGFNSVTFSVNGKSTGAPLPPSPEFGGSSARVKSKVYLFVYGSIGPIGSVSAGNYLAEVNLNVYVAGGDN